MNTANKVTILRLLLTPFFVGCLIYYTPEKDFLRISALIIFSAAVVSDGIDGYIARVWKQRTTLGAFLDPLADKILLTTAFITLSVVDNMPLGINLPYWVPIIVISRDMLILLGSTGIYIIKQKIEITPRPLGKITTFFQMITIISVLLQCGFSNVVRNIAMGFTIISCIDYIREGNRILNSHS